MANITYTVKKGDTLSEIAVTYASTIGSSLTLNQRINKLVELNDITDRDHIVVGQVLILSTDGSVVNTPKKATTSNRATIKAFGLQSNTENTVYATWTWTKDNTKNYKIKWYYATGDGVWFIGSEAEVMSKQSTYSAPSNATGVKFIVKPISKTKKVNNKEVNYWTADWSTAKYYYFKNNPPSKPATPTVTVDNLKLTARLENLDINATDVQFEVVKNDETRFKIATVKITKSVASYTCSITAGQSYKVRARGYKNKEYGDWSEYSSNVDTIPAAPKGWVKIKALTETSVLLDWYGSTTATSYEVQYTTKKKYFDSSNDVQSITVNEGTSLNHAEITGLESGQEYFFRVRAINDAGKSSWSTIESIKVGKVPTAPTTWSSTTTVKNTESLTLYWLHSSEDGSSQSSSILEMNVDGTTKTYTISGNGEYAIDKNGELSVIKSYTSDDDKGKTTSCKVDISNYRNGAKIKWKVRTKGIIDKYGDWSVQRTVDVYDPPTLTISVTNSNGIILPTVKAFPIYVRGEHSSYSQTAIGYHVSVISNSSYVTTDNIGNSKIVNIGDEIYSKYLETDQSLCLELLPGTINLENNASYTVKATVSMDSGLTADDSTDFDVSWTDEEYAPNAEIGIDKNLLAAIIRPFCEDAENNLIEGVSLSVYRREFDGSFTEIATGIDNMSNTHLIDPHPALDYARYRIVAMDNSTGSISYTDIPGYPVGEVAAVIQWDEDWSNFDTSIEDESEQPIWAGSMLKLPYNLDVSDDHGNDVEFVEYIGRPHPVSYYGTHLGETSTWNLEIDREDKETLYSLRRLGIYMGDVYVREPSGSGYWANVSVSISQKHCAVTIPVTLKITRVAGGA